MPAYPRPDAQRGFSLLEVMIGAAIALIGIVVIFQVLSVWEARKRTTSSGSDAQIAGALAMFNLARDVKLAGYGFSKSTNMGCTVSAYDSTRATPAFNFLLQPVQIINGAAGAPDQLVVLYGNSSFFVSNQVYATTTATSKTTQSGSAVFQPGELVVVDGNTAANCALVEVTLNTANGGLTIDHVAGAYTNYMLQNVNSRYNDPGGAGGAFGAGTLYNLGPAQQWQAPGAGSPAVTVPRLNTWQIQNGRVLAWSDGLHTSTTWSEVAEGIVNLQAEYGIDANNDNMIGAGEWTAVTPTTPATWSQVRAVRVALLARSQQFEKDAVYKPAGCTDAGCAPAAPRWASGYFTMTNADGTADSSTDDANDWRHYRFRVYQEVIPLRNMIWGTAP